MNAFKADDHLRGLTDFQRRSVDHVVTQFFDAGARRFLVADETGLGKTRVARGVVARTIEKLQHDDSVQRIDIVYVCANADLAHQNIGRLNVTGTPALPFGRLSLLPLHAKDLVRESVDGSKPVNLISFTPGTSFDVHGGEGVAAERAVLHVVLCQLLELDEAQQRTSLRIFQGGVRTVESFRDNHVSWVAESLRDGVEERIAEKFTAQIFAVREGADGGSLAHRFRALIAEIGDDRELAPDVNDRRWRCVSALRAAMAAASVETLEPDLVIMDEFQRFTHLLEKDNPAGELFHELCSYNEAKTLLLSATPYKPFTRAVEGESHSRELYRTLEALGAGRSDFDIAKVQEGLARFRVAVQRGERDATVAAEVRHELMKVMSRAERPVLPEGLRLEEHVDETADVTANDLASFVRLSKVAQELRTGRDRGLFTVEYWKSAPYFINFCGEYQLGARLKGAPKTTQLSSLLTATSHLDAEALTGFSPISPGNARMARLFTNTLEKGWWKLLWMPPTMPYYALEEPFIGHEGMTKQLVFSSWTATPTAVASLLSYEADRRITQEPFGKHRAAVKYSEYSSKGREAVTTHLRYGLTDGKAASMSTLAMFWPMAELASLGDPLKHRDGCSSLTREGLLDRVKSALSQYAEGVAEATDDANLPWRVAFGRDGNWSNAAWSDIGRAMGGKPRGEKDPEEAKADDPPESSVLQTHFDRAANFERAAKERTSTPSVGATAGGLDRLAELAAFSPANIAWRSLNRLSGDAVTPGGLFLAAATLANGLRTLFNRPDATTLIEKLYSGDGPFWAGVLRYCAAGNLEAVLDEYLFHLAADVVEGAMNDEGLLALATEAASALSLTVSTYRARGARESDPELAFPVRFALRYSAGRSATADDARQPEVRRAFNSPFWPFVLASTSVGQEGIDFHWWSHSVFHWNLPSNPVDFEQREGRVDRFRGHVIRKNIVERHGGQVLRNLDQTEHVWAQLYAAATDLRDEYGDFTPGWVYPGSAKIERHLAPYAFSKDTPRYNKMKADVDTYRLTFGQPRQESLLEEIQRKRAGERAALEGMRIDLMP